MMGTPGIHSGCVPFTTTSPSAQPPAWHTNPAQQHVLSSQHTAWIISDIIYILISDNTLLTLGPASQQPVPVLEPGKGQQVSPRSQQVSWSGHSLCSDPQSPRPSVCSRTLSGPRNVKHYGSKASLLAFLCHAGPKQSDIRQKECKEWSV